MPEVKALVTRAEKVTLGGGWVYAVGEGSLADPRSELHRRDRIGILRRGCYIAVDTGKYSCGPSLAETVVRDICA